MYNITFRNLKDNQDEYKKLHKWCQNKFVYEWFEQRILSYDEIVNKYKNKLTEKKQYCFPVTLKNTIRSTASEETASKRPKVYKEWPIV